MFVSEAALHKEGVKLAKDANLVIASQDKLKACCFALEEALSAIYKGCRAYPFGSRVSGLGNKVVCFYTFVVCVYLKRYN